MAAKQKFTEVDDDADNSGRHYFLLLGYICSLILLYI